MNINNIIIIWTLIASGSGCTSSEKTKIAVVSNLNLLNHGTN